MTWPSTKTQTKPLKKSKLRLQPDALLQTLPQPWEPKLHHELGVKYLLEHANAGLFLDPGLGKTSITLAATKVLMNERLVRRTLVIAPLRPCYLVWPKERTKWLDFQHYKMEVLHGSKKEAALQRDADIYIINPDGLPWLCADNRLTRLGIDTLVIDESSKFKNTQTRRFKLLRPWIPKFKRRWILTGSPSPKNYLDLFGQVYILDLGRALGHYITHYRNTYFYPSGYGGYEWKLQDGAKERIHKAIKPLVLRLDAADYIKLPEVVENTIRVDLPDKARKLYDKLEEDMIATLENGAKVSAVSAGALTSKVAQVANGGLYYTPDGQTIMDAASDLTTTKFESWLARERKTAVVHDAKTEALVDLVDELQGTPLLVGVEFQHDVERIRAALGKNLPCMVGGTSINESTRIEAAWNAGDIPVLVAHPAAMGHGLNMQESGNHVCWYGITWDYELYDQFIRRIRRSGSKAAQVFVHHIVATNTVDEVKMRSLVDKHKTQKELLDALRLYVRSRRRK